MSTNPEIQLYLNTVPKTTHELNEGDTVLYYGCVFQLKNRKVHPMEPGFCPKLQGECITFETDLLVYSADCGMPRHWADRWTIQGNKLAVWSLLVNPQK